jgi:hypothetical protein
MKAPSLLNGYGTPRGDASLSRRALTVKRWTILACGLAIVFFALALSTTVYEVTSPSALSWHVVLRKAYSIIAFSLVGYAARRAFDEHAISRSPLVTVLAVAAYSALIEIAQTLEGSQEGLAWNAVDVLCGALGGLIGDAIVRRSARTPPAQG